MNEKNEKLPNDLVRDIGEYYVCLKLSQLGFHAALAGRNAKGVDIVAYCKDTLRTTTIQVKAYHDEGQTTVCDRTEGYQPTDDPVFCNGAIAKFWVLVLLGKEFHGVKSVHVWPSSKKTVLISGEVDGKPKWRVEPHGTKREANKKWWDAHEGEKGWRCIVNHLQRGAGRKI